MNGAGNQFLSRAAFAGDQDAAVLRRDVFDQIEDGAHLGAGADDVIKTREAAKFAAEIAGFFLKSQIFGALLDGGAEFVDQAVALDDVAVGAEIDGVNRRADGGNACDQNESGCGRDFLAIAQQLDAVHIRHADIGNDDIEDLRSEPTLGRFAAGGHFDLVALLSEADFEQFADRSLVVDDKQLSHTRVIPSLPDVPVHTAALWG